MAEGSSRPTLDTEGVKKDGAGDSLGERDAAYAYLREKIAQFLAITGASSPSAAALDDANLLNSDALGAFAGRFSELLGDLNKANERLRLVHEDMRAVFDMAGVAIMVVDNDFNVMAHNKLAFEDFGLSEGSMIYRHCYENICKSPSPPPYCALAETLKTKRRTEKSGLKIGNKSYDVVATPIIGEDGEVLHTVLTYMDITARQKAMEAVAESEKRYRDLFESANDLIQISSADGRILYANSAWRKATGYADTTGVDLSKLLPPRNREDFMSAVLAAKEREQGVRIETEFITADKRKLLLDGNVTVRMSEGGEMVVRTIFRDITRQRRLEEEIATAQRMDTVGQLAGGIAHDFNNALTAILGNISLAKMYEASGLPVKDKLEKAEQAVIRARGLTRQLLTFSTGGAPVKKELALSPFLVDAVSFSLTGSKLSPRYNIARDVNNVDVDQGQLEQVIQNLVLNAAQAMPEGGFVDIECSNATIDDESVLPVPHGEYVRISVVDHGTGIPEANRERIFDPFFTTKDGGKGLGLATSFSIVRKHGGTIHVQSALGKGSRFDVYLPAKERKEQPQELKAQIAGVGGSILIMDDEGDIRELLESLLTHLGYKVASAPDGQEAEKMYKKAFDAGEPYDLVIMDLTVPGGMGGKELMQRLIKIDPRVVGIVSSGYSSDPVMSDYTSHGFSGVAAKPYRLETLTGIVATLIASRRAMSRGRP